jgi:uncharacterized cupredoxin-like copper-binding protein
MSAEVKGRGRARLVTLLVVATLCPMLVGLVVDAAAANQPPPLGPGLVTVEMGMSYSRFAPKEIRVYQGTLVRFVVTNDDPIHHEFIVGPDRVHAMHESGHDMHHPPVPGEVSVNPGERGLTTYLFDEPGTVAFACHLPGHLAYGMSGAVTVVPQPE